MTNSFDKHFKPTNAVQYSQVSTSTIYPFNEKYKKSPIEYQLNYLCHFLKLK